MGKGLKFAPTGGCNIVLSRMGYCKREAKMTIRQKKRKKVSNILKNIPKGNVYVVITSRIKEVLSGALQLHSTLTIYAQRESLL